MNARSETALVMLATGMGMDELINEIFAEILWDSFLSCENSARSLLESHEIPEGGSRSFFGGVLCLSLLNEDKITMNVNYSNKNKITTSSTC